MACLAFLSFVFCFFLTSLHDTPDFSLGLAANCKSSFIYQRRFSFAGADAVFFFFSYPLILHRGVLEPSIFMTLNSTYPPAHTYTIVVGRHHLYISYQSACSRNKEGKPLLLYICFLAYRV